MARNKPSLLERLRAKKQQPKAMPSFAVVWYAEEEEWAKVKAASTDPLSFEDSYDQWRAMVESSLSKYAQVGIQFNKVLVQAEALAAWCRLHDKPCNSSARAEYVTEMAQARPNT